MTIAWLTPPALPTSAQCRRIRIPDAPLIRQAVYGALTQLTKPYNWENGGASPEDTAELMLAMVSEFLNAEYCMIGTLVPYLTQTIPPNCLPCDGTTYDCADYPELAAVLHSVFLNPDDTFTLPNLDETYLAQVSGGFGLYEITGDNEVSLEIEHMPRHRHTVSIHTHAFSPVVGPGEIPVALPETPSVANSSYSGFGDPHPNMPRTFFVRFCVICR